MTTKQEFLIEHNKLSSPGMQATMDMLMQFQNDKPSLLLNDDWSIAKVRRPFILWLTSSMNKA